MSYVFLYVKQYTLNLYLYNLNIIILFIISII